MEIVFSLIALFFAIVLHEIAHGYVAFLLGDDTAKKEKRLSINPINHIDPFGTIIVPLILFFSNIGFVFGWAKPVPVNYYNLKNFKRDVFLVSSAGIVTNLILAFLSAIIIKFLIPLNDSIAISILLEFLKPFVLYNIILAVFNLIPIPPLDGSKMIFNFFIEKPWAYKYLNNERLGFAIIIIAGAVLPSIIHFDILGFYIKETTSFIIGILP